MPLADGARLAALYREGEVLSRSQTETEHELVVRLDTWQVDRLRQEGMTVVPVEEGRALRKVSGE